MTTTLLDHAIWWHVYPLGATGAPIHDRRVLTHPGEDAEHRLPRLEPWLDYVIELGCSGLLLGPIFESTAHGYDTVDHYRIDARLGDDADFDALMEACRERGLSVVLDGVFNHVGVLHPAAQERDVLVRTRGDGARGSAAVELEPWEGHGDLALLHHDAPAVEDFVTDVMLYWLRRGIAGWRLDVAYAVPTAFWRRVLARVRNDFPDALFIGEIIQGDYSTFVQDSTVDTVTQYELWKGIWSAIHDRNLWELAWSLQRHQEFCQSFVPQTFVGNHDVTRIASQVGNDGAALAAVVLFTVPGMPSVYAGDEQAFHGKKGTGRHADDQLRAELPATPGDLHPLGQEMHRLYHDLIGLRRRNAWLARADLRVIAKENTKLTYESRGEGQVLRVELDLERSSARVTVDGVEAYAWKA